MTGVYSSYAQAWQERARHAVHRVETDRPHACLEVEISACADGALDVRVVADRRREVAHETWHAEGGAVRLPERSLFARVEAVPGGLASVVASGVWANPEPYRLLRARRFRGWVEVPAEGEAPPFGTGTAYHRVAGLALHDQGGVVEVEGRGGPLAIELSRLLYGRSLEVLKLAVYEVPAAEVHRREPRRVVRLGRAGVRAPRDQRARGGHGVDAGGVRAGEQRRRERPALVYRVVGVGGKPPRPPPRGRMAVPPLFKLMLTGRPAPLASRVH